jgi:hypothetical protein
MPGYQGHLLGGAVAFGVARFLLIPVLKDISSIDAIYLTLTLLGSLFPDVDIKSKGQKIFYSIAFVVASIAIAKQIWSCLSWLGIICFIPLALPHRGPMHNPYVLIATPWILSYSVQKIFPSISKISPLFHFFFIIGAVSHLLLDFGLKKTIQKLFFLK